MAVGVGEKVTDGARMIVTTIEEGVNVFDPHDTDAQTFVTAPRCQGLDGCVEGAGGDDDFVGSGCVCEDIGRGVIEGGSQGMSGGKSSVNCTSGPTVAKGEGTVADVEVGMGEENGL